MTNHAGPRPTLDTDRLTLRALVSSDAERLALLCNDYDVAKMTAVIPHPYALADAQAYLARVQAHDPAREAAFAIDLPGEGLIGVLGFHPGDELGPEVGYWIGQPYWGRGYATESLLAAMAWAQDVWGKRCVTAGHYVDNPTSGVVLIHGGFLYTGQTELKPCVARGEAVLSRRMVWLA
ncbi:MAG: GNAT family N-acetyltransferase [Caulobacterales bacterium]